MPPRATPAASQGAAPEGRPAMREAFEAQVDGKPVDLDTLRNAAGFEVAVTNYGAKLQRLLVPDRDGAFGDVVLGYDSIDAVLHGHASMNAFIGRYANRIAGARFTLDGREHRLSANSGGHCLHGGAKGSRLRVFDVRRAEPQALELHHVFADGEEGFPGTLPMTVTYALAEDGALTLEWSATAEGAATVASFTGHAFFNLTGDPATSVEDHVLTIAASHHLPLSAALVPTGEIRPVAGTPMDFRSPRRIGRDIAAADEQLQLAGGYDHYFVLDSQPGADGLRLAARVEDPASGRVLEVHTTEPGLQFYSGNHLGGPTAADVGKGGRRFAFRGGLCLEPSRYPDAPNQPSCPSAVLRPGETFSGRIVYRFSARA